MDEMEKSARAFLRGKQLSFAEADLLWTGLKRRDDISLARQVLERIRSGHGLRDGVPAEERDRLCQQEALLTSKDSELKATMRHDRALRILYEGIGNVFGAKLDTDAETLGIAGGILKRRWGDLGQMEDLRRAAGLYERGAKNPLGNDAYTQINAAFMDDLLAHAGDDPTARRERAAALRQRILTELPAAEDVPTNKAWFNTASRAEAHFGLGEYAMATEVLRAFTTKLKPDPWELETTARQLAMLAHIREEHPLDVKEIREFFEALLPGAAEAARSAMIGKVGLALSGGGFRASFYHLGVLARLAELNVLRHVDVLSCVSGGSIVGACYWLALRRRMLDRKPLEWQDYINIVNEVIEHFMDAVAGNLREAVRPSLRQVAWGLLLKDKKGAMDPERTAAVLTESFYKPLGGATPPVYMHELAFNPADHDPKLTGSESFHPGKHNWLRANKVPVLVLNATSVNTGHAWQFTPTWMGESPWAVHEEADSIPRLEWSWYNHKKGWSMELGRAVAASASVPGVFNPLEIRDAYEDVLVQLVDGGVHDNQGTVSVLALNCNVVLVSDACGQLLLEKKSLPGIGGLAAYANRSMSTLMERVRLASYSDLAARKEVGLLRGFMFLHMKAGLDADTIRLRFSQESYSLRREPLSPSGVRKDIQQALAELRTDLDAFTEDESNALMACGYQMSCWAFDRDLARLKELWDNPPAVVEWPFKAMLEQITSTDPPAPGQDTLLQSLRKGSKREL